MRKQTTIVVIGALRVNLLENSREGVQGELQSQNLVYQYYQED